MQISGNGVFWGGKQSSTDVSQRVLCSGKQDLLSNIVSLNTLLDLQKYLNPYFSFLNIRNSAILILMV